jgi:hypothetical protein
MVFPLILGDAGREPMYAEYPLTKLELLDTRVLDSRVLLLEYGPMRGEQKDGGRRDGMWLLQARPV